MKAFRILDISSLEFLDGKNWTCESQEFLVAREDKMMLSIILWLLKIINQLEKPISIQLTWNQKVHCG